MCFLLPTENIQLVSVDILLFSAYTWYMKKNMLPQYLIYNVYVQYLIRLIVINLQCFEVLKCLGLPCIKAPGEAEAYCAWLDENGVSNQTCKTSIWTFDGMH